MNAQPTSTFLAALAAEAGAAPRIAPKPIKAVASPMPADAILLGDGEVGGPVGIRLDKLIDSRLLIQGASGAGKSWTLRRLLEQTVGKIQQVILDPEGEFRSYAEAHGHAIIDASALDAAALRVAALRAREHRLSIFVDLSDLEREDQMIAVAAVLRALVDAPREHWTTTLVAIDEAHLFAPYGGEAGTSSTVRKAAISAVTDLMSRGRKRGLCGVLATQRLARLAKSVASEIQSFLIGINTLDLDIRRAAETIGWDARRGFDRLPMLEPGSFVAVGPCFTRGPIILKVGPVTSHHRGASPALSAPARMTPAEAAALLDLDALAEGARADAGLRAEFNMPDGARAVRDVFRDAALPIAARIFEAIAPLAPQGARLAELATHLQADAGGGDFAAGLALLDRFGMVDFTGDGADRAVRLDRGMTTTKGCAR